MTSFKISKPCDFTPEMAVYQLGRNNEAGEPLVVKIRAVSKAQISALFKGFPSRPNTKTETDIEAEKALADEVIEKRNAEAAERLHGLLRAACVEPGIVFDGEDNDGTKVNWDALDNATQEAWTNAILEHSGFKLPPEAEAMLAFRLLERGGVSVG